MVYLWANIPDVSEYHRAFIFMIKQSKNNGMLDPKNENTKALRRAAEYLPNEKTSRVSRHKFSNVRKIT